MEVTYLVSIGLLFEDKIEAINLQIHFPNDSNIQKLLTGLLVAIVSLLEYISMKAMKVCLNQYQFHSIMIVIIQSNNTATPKQTFYCTFVR